MAGEAKTKWERLQSRFKNSWLGVSVLGVVALGALASQLGDLVARVDSWFASTPTADLVVTEVAAEPLPKFKDLAVSAGQDMIFPVAATVTIDLRHNLQGDDDISVKSLDALVQAYDPAYSCPFKLTGDRIIGAGSAPVNEFTAVLSNGAVQEVRRVEYRNDAQVIMRGHSSDLLDIDPPFTIILKKGGPQSAPNASTETVKVTFIAADSGRYVVGLAIRYTTLSGLKSAELKPVTICTPKA